MPMNLLDFKVVDFLPTHEQAVNDMINSDPEDRFMYGARSYQKEQARGDYWEPAFVILYGSEVVGFMELEAVTQDSKLQVNGIFIKKEYRGKHLSRLLIDRAVESARMLNLKILKAVIRGHNNASINTFKKYGFKQSGEDFFGVLYKWKRIKKLMFYYIIPPHDKEKEGWETPHESD